MIYVHSKPNCPYCVKAKDLLKTTGIPYEEITYDPETEDYTSRRDVLIAKTNHRTFPQVFDGERFVGGFTELAAEVDEGIIAPVLAFTEDF